MDPFSHYEYEKYVTDKHGVREMVYRYGVAIVPTVLDETEIRDMQDGMWDTLEHLTGKFAVPIDRKNPKTWKGLKGLFPLHNSYGI